jgi:hypothetical protein
MADVLANIVVTKYGAFREGSAARSRVTTRVHSARRSPREPASIPARTSGREQPSGPGPGSAPSPNRGVAHAPIGSWDCERRSTAGTKRRPQERAGHSLEVAGPVTDPTRDFVDARRCVQREWSLFTLRFSTPTTAFCRGSPRGVSHSNPDAGTIVKRRPRSHQVLCSDHGLDSSPPTSGSTALTRGANSLSAWRERPRPWPQARQTKRPFRVVAHAPGLLLATLRQCATRRAAQSAARGRQAATGTTIGSCRMR